MRASNLWACVRAAGTNGMWRTKLIGNTLSAGAGRGLLTVGPHFEPAERWAEPVEPLGLGCGGY